MLALAFHDDAAWVHIFPDARRRRRSLPGVFRTSLLYGLAGGRVHAVGEPVAGVAQWLPPDEPELRAGRALRAGFATIPFRLGAALPRFVAYGRACQELRRRASPGRHWYLAGIGVDPAEQRRGVGGSLLQPGLEAAEGAGESCLLLTNNPDNLSFYAGHGFAVVAAEETPPGGPPAWALVRPAPAS